MKKVRICARIVMTILLALCGMSVSTNLPVAAALAVGDRVSQTQALVSPMVGFTVSGVSLQSATILTPTVFLPLMVYNSCGATGQTYETIAFDGDAYKNNKLSDQNADFRLSILGYVATSETPGLVEYGGATDQNAPKMQGIFLPHRVPTFVKAYRVYHWNWNENGLPPYGTRGSVNQSPVVSVLDVVTSRGETISIPERNPSIMFNYKAMVLYASEYEITLVYLLQDAVATWDGHGYVVHMTNLCVDPTLVSLYRAQLDQTGRRNTNKQLPVLRNNQPLGTASGSILTIAVRDGGAYMDPRSRKDWWVNPP